MTALANLTAGTSFGQKAFSTDYGQCYWNGSQWIPRDSSPVSILFANLPPAYSVPPGLVQYTTDVGPVWNTGSAWAPIGAYASLGTGKLVAQWGVPIITVSSGAVSATGLLTGLTALTATPGNCWVSLPAGYLSSSGAGSAAGVYFGQGVSTTSIQVFNNLLSPGTVPSPAATPLNPASFSGLSGGTATQVTGSAITVVTLPIQPATLGPNGRLRARGCVTNNNSANSKQLNINFGTLSAGTPVNNTTNVSAPFDKEFVNTGGATNAQMVFGGAGFAAVAGPPNRTAQETNNLINLTITLQLATSASDTVTLEYAYIEAVTA